MLSIFLMWMIIGIGILVWIIFMLRYMPESGQYIENPKSKLFLMILPIVLLIGSGFYFMNRHEDKISQACGTIIEYKTYMTAGNKHKRKPFQRVEILFQGQQYSRHIKIDDALMNHKIGEYHCFEFYDRKLNAHMQDSKLVRWLDESRYSR